MNSPHYGQVLIATLIGLALAAVSKLTYDLFNGYAVVPNLLLGFGFLPSPVLIDSLLLLVLLTISFGTGTVLFKMLSIAPRQSATLAALPWVALSLLGFAAGLLGEHGPAVRALFGSSPTAFLQELCVIFSVPTGLWLAFRRPQNRSEA